MSDQGLIEGLSSEEDDSLSDENTRIGEDASEVAIDFQRKKIERLHEEIQDIKQDREQRKVFSSRIFIFMCAYMAVAIIIVFCCGLKTMYLPESVLITLLTTTLANVIGIFTFVAKYLFHNK